jgi:hypothetical protein
MSCPVAYWNGATAEAYRNLQRCAAGNAIPDRVV